MSKSVGASTSDFGILSGLLAIIFVNWSAFNGSQQLEQTRCILVFMVIFMIVINLLVSVGQAGTVDINGHLGGLFAGMFWGLAFFPRSPSANPKMRMWGLGLTAVFFGGLTVALFTTNMG